MAGTQTPRVPAPAPAAPEPGASRTIDFHFNVDHRIGYACRVVRKALGAGKTVLVFSRDAARLARFDLALWTFSALDFLPHVDAGSPLADQTPVWLAHTPIESARDVLILLDDAPAPQFDAWFPRFARVIDIVSGDAEDRAQARVRFKTYRDAGWSPVAHEVGTP